MAADSKAPKGLSTGDGIAIFGILVFIIAWAAGAIYVLTTGDQESAKVLSDNVDDGGGNPADDVVEERLGPAAGVHEPQELAVGLRDAPRLGPGAALVGVRVVVGQREEEEVEEVVLDEERPHAAAVAVALARIAEQAAAPRAAAGEEIGVEQLAGPHHGPVAEQAAGDERAGRELPRHLVAVAPAVDQVRRASSADVRIV